MIDLKFKFDTKQLKEIADSMEEEITLEYGYFERLPLNAPAEGLKSIGKGLQGRKVGKRTGGDSVELAIELENKYGFLTKPADEKSREMQGLMEQIISYKLYGNKEAKNKVVNSAKALVLKPILNDKYGRNSKETAENKGFNKFLIDTGQTIKRLAVRISKGKGKEIVDDNSKI